METKFVDDTTALEIIPRNSMSLTNIVADNINDFAESNHMKLNPKKWGLANSRGSWVVGRMSWVVGKKSWVVGRG